MLRCTLKLLLVGVMVTSACVPAQTSAIATSPSPGPVPLETQIDSIFARFGPTTPGCAAGVYRAGEVVFVKGYGMANLEHGVPLTPETPIDVGAVTRQFTAFAVHLLAGQGRLWLDDDVRAHLPELPELGPVTLRHMLTHTSGLRDLFQLRLLAYPGWWANHLSLSLSRAEAMDLLSRQRALNFAPGERAATSNTDWMLLAMVVERASGRPFAEFMEQEVFAPRGMARTHVLDDPLRVVPGRAVSYMPAANGGYRAWGVWSVVHGLPGSSHLHSTIGDLGRWEASLHDDAGAAAMLAAMYERARLAAGDTIRFGHGVSVGEYRGLQMIHHGGQWDHSELIRFPERALAVAVLCNSHEPGFDSGALARAIADLHLDGASKAPLASPARDTVVQEAELARYAGSFVSTTGARPREFVAHEGSLAEREGDRLWPMTARGGGRFEDGQIRVDFAADGTTATILVKHDGSRVPLTRMPEDWRPWAPTAVELVRYQGTWRSAEVGADWTLRMEGDTLIVRRSGAAEDVLLPLTPDRFRLRDAGFTLEFRHHSEKGAGRMLLSMSRTQQLEFARVSAR